MGEYWKPVNLTRGEFIHPHHVDCGLKLGEWWEWNGEPVESNVRRVMAEHIRLGAYGDPAALPFEVWRVVLETVSGWTGYTHQWRACDPRFKTMLMASVDTRRELHEAQGAGWRTFRVRSQAESLHADEVMCPASDEGEHRATCHTCELCRGQANPARSVAIIAHGNPGQLANFYRREQVS